MVLPVQPRQKRKVLKSLIESACYKVYAVCGHKKLTIQKCLDNILNEIRPVCRLSHLPLARGKSNSSQSNLVSAHPRQEKKNSDIISSPRVQTDIHCKSRKFQTSIYFDWPHVCYGLQTSIDAVLQNFLRMKALSSILMLKFYNQFLLL